MSEQFIEQEISVFTVPVTSVVVKGELPRFRKDLGDLKALAESIQRFGQLHPVVVTRNMELIAGGRRLAACTFAQIPVKCIYHDVVDPLIMREIELEENIQRKALTPAEEVLAVREMHDLKQMLHGQSSSGKHGVGWTLDKTAEVLEKTRGAVIDDLKLANMVQMFPELKEAKTKSEIRKAAKSLEKVLERADANTRYEAIAKTNSHLPKAYLKDAKEFMKELPNASVDLLLTDPPYGISIEQLMLGAGKVTGGTSSAGFKFDDSAEKAMDLYATLAKESYRFCKFNAHAYVFVAPEFFPFLRVLFQEAGWKVFIKPLIWIKQGSGQTQAPDQWPASCYEMIMYCRKDDSKLILEGKPDWLQCDIVQPSVRIHPTEKPVALLKELISRTTFPGSTMVDPFAGSGASLVAAYEMKIAASGCDELQEAFNAIAHRLANMNLPN